MKMLFWVLRWGFRVVLAWWVVLVALVLVASRAHATDVLAAMTSQAATSFANIIPDLVTIAGKAFAVPIVLLMLGWVIQNVKGEHVEDSVDKDGHAVSGASTELFADLVNDDGTLENAIEEANPGPVQGLALEGDYTMGVDAWCEMNESASSDEDD
jgi:hypothetical protein